MTEWSSSAVSVSSSELSTMTGLAMDPTGDVSLVLFWGDFSIPEILLCLTLLS